MDWELLSFLSTPWFVLSWYAVGVIGAAVVAFDLRTKNTPLKTAMRWAWPIVVVFFSVIGLALYYGTARAPGIGRIQAPEQKQHAHQEYEKNMFRRVNGAVIHCVAGDGLGVMTGMVIARAVRMSFWQEFWFEYAVGFAFGWFIFQYKSMKMMTDSAGKALLMAFRAEFFSMLTVMAGMGSVMTYVTPMVVTAQPRPLTYAFWGFGALGLIVGYVLTFPMNWMMVKIGWKHGMGGRESAPVVEAKPVRVGLITAMGVLGAAALVLPAWLTEAREGRPVERPPEFATGGGPQGGLTVLAQGLRGSLQEGNRNLEQHHRDRASHAIDSALRAAEVGHKAAPGSTFDDALDEVRSARHELHMGNEARAQRALSAAANAIGAFRGDQRPPPPSLDRYQGALLVNAAGVEIGEVTAVEGQQVELALGGARDVWGFWDLGAKQRVTVPAGELLFGPSRFIGSSLVAFPTMEVPPFSAPPAVAPTE